MVAKKSASQKIAKKKLDLRQELWPEVTDDMLWNRKKKTGFTTIPRTMAYIIQIMDSLASGKPPGRTYLTLWCHTFDENMVTITNPRAMAFESGFTGQRAEATWSGRMKTLVELGFIDAAPGASGNFNYVLIFNPYNAIKKLKDNGAVIPLDIYNALRERTKDIGATDLI